MATEDKDTCCSICLDPYEEEGEKRPVLLLCSHTLCFACLSDLEVTKKQFRCPECRREHWVPKAGLERFPTNRYMLQIVKLTAQNKQVRTGTGSWTNPFVSQDRNLLHEDHNFPTQKFVQIYVKFVHMFASFLLRFVETSLGGFVPQGVTREDEFLK